MADQATGTVQPAGAPGAAAVSQAQGPQHLEHFNGRPISWVGVGTAIGGSIIGGWAFLPPAGPPVLWPLFWVGVAIMLVGLLVLGFAKTFSSDWY